MAVDAVDIEVLVAAKGKLDTCLNVLMGWLAGKTGVCFEEEDLVYKAVNELYAASVHLAERIDEHENS